jgi:hypothetical protein
LYVVITEFSFIKLTILIGSQNKHFKWGGFEAESFQACWFGMKSYVLNGASSMDLLVVDTCCRVVEVWIGYNSETNLFSSFNSSCKFSHSF